MSNENKKRKHSNKNSISNFKKIQNYNNNNYKIDFTFFQRYGIKKRYGFIFVKKNR